MNRLFLLLLVIFVSLANSGCNESVTAQTKELSVTTLDLKIDDSIKLTNDFSIELADVTDLRCELNVCDRCFPNVAIVNLVLKNKEHKQEVSVNYPGCFENPEESALEKILEMDGSKYKMIILAVTPYDNSLDKKIKFSIQKI